MNEYDEITSFIAQHPETPVLRKELTKELAEALRRELGIDNPILSIVIDGRGRVYELEIDSRQVIIDQFFPQKTTEISSVYSCTFVSFKGSWCVYFSDSNGYMKKFCFN